MLGSANLQGLLSPCPVPTHTQSPTSLLEIVVKPPCLKELGQRFSEIRGAEHHLSALRKHFHNIFLHCGCNSAPNPRHSLWAPQLAALQEALAGQAGGMGPSQVSLCRASLRSKPLARCGSLCYICPTAAAGLHDCTNSGRK